jgi:amino acid transporter
MIMIIAIFSGWTVFLDGKWDTAQFLTNYIPLGLFPLLFVIKKLYSKTSWRKASEMDFFTNIPEIEADCYDEPEPTTWYGKVGAAVF